MAFDEPLAQRVREFFHDNGVVFDERRMMGALCILVQGKMCVGIVNDRLMARIDPEIYEQALTRTGCVPMDFTGRPMRGFVFVTPLGTKSRSKLASWLELALEFNPRATASRRKPVAKPNPGRRSKVCETPRVRTQQGKK